MIKDLKELEKLLKLCRKQGVVELSFGGVSMKLGDLPEPQQQLPEEERKSFLESFPQGELTPEQLMYYSAGGLPENDPYGKNQ